VGCHSCMKAVMKGYPAGAPETAWRVFITIVLITSWPGEARAARFDVTPTYQRTGGRTGGGLHNVGLSAYNTRQMPDNNSCFAICGDPAHGSTGWTGPIRTGPTAEQQAQQDADNHNAANPGHDASSSC